MRYFLKNVATDELLKMKRTPAVYHELLVSRGVRDEVRRDIAGGLAKLEGKTELRLSRAIQQQDVGSKEGPDESLSFDYLRLLSSRPAGELAAWCADLEKLATAGKAPVTRQLGVVALVAADGNPDRAWALATKSPSALRDFVTPCRRSVIQGSGPLSIRARVIAARLAEGAGFFSDREGRHGSLRPRRDSWQPADADAG